MRFGQFYAEIPECEMDLVLPSGAPVSRFGSCSARPIRARTLRSLPDVRSEALPATLPRCPSHSNGVPVASSNSVTSGDSVSSWIAATIGARGVVARAPRPAGLLPAAARPPSTPLDTPTSLRDNRAVPHETSPDVATESTVKGATAASVLNPLQLAAVQYGAPSAEGAWSAGPLLVIAGAGTGKTSTLAHRVAHLVLNGVAPDRILLLTFSRRAAEEMMRRAHRIVAQSLTAKRNADAAASIQATGVRLPWAGTFHSVASRLLRRHARRLGLEPGFSVMDRSDSADLLDVVRHELKLSSRDRRFPRKDTCLAIYSHCINTRFPLEKVLADTFPWCAEWETELKALFRQYVDAKLAQQVLDFDDLLLYWHVLMQEGSLAQEVGARFDHILVDEYQDTNSLQAEILLALRPTGAGLCVVGDDAQSIYSFRAANIENILDFPARFSPPAHTVTLEDNYRSTQPLLDAANALMAEASRQYRKDLRAQCGVGNSGTRPRHVTVLDDQAQAQYIVERVLATREEGVALRRQAVLFRSSHHSDVLELELVRRNIPYVKYGGLKFLEAAHVKDLLAILRWADNPRNRIAAFRVLQLMPGVGPGNADRCWKAFEASDHTWAALASYRAPAAARDDWAALIELLRAIGSTSARWEGQIGLARRWYEPQLTRLYEAATARSGDLEQLERIALQFTARERFLSELALDPPSATSDISNAASLDEDFLILSTVHSAKGQEWDRVLVLNVSDGNFPNEYAAGKPELIEEERRLLYVAMTRARNELDLISPLKYYVTRQPRTGDAHVYGARSRFLTPRVMATFDAFVWPTAEQGQEHTADNSLPRVNLAVRLKGMWS
jgi:DNA helicase-2/ATP-dependent DNA helicase PcrA